MDRVAESGVASHWQYKAEDKSTATPQRRAREWLAHLAEIQKAGSSEEFIRITSYNVCYTKLLRDLVFRWNVSCRHGQYPLTGLIDENRKHGRRRCFVVDDLHARHA